MLKGKMLTASNLLSLFRVSLLFPIYLGLSQNTMAGNIWALFFMFLAIVSDFLDGFLARRLGQISDLGKVLDPLADKICILGMCLFLALPMRENPLPFWFLLVLLTREVAILAGGYLIYRHRGVIVTSNIWGKSTSTVLALMLISYVIKMEEAPVWLSWLNCQTLLWLSLSFMFVSLVSYGWRFYLVLGGRKGIEQSGVLKTGGAGRRAQTGQKEGNS